MTFPFAIMLISGLMWFFWAVVLPDNSPPPIPRFGPWFIDVCRIVFAASALVVLYGLINKPVF